MGQTISEENYLKAIWHLVQEEESANTNALAALLKARPASVSEMVKKLHEKGLITHERYKGVTLTEQGSAIAVQIVRKHRLWEVFLLQKLHFSWDRVHDSADQLEHIQSDELIDKLEAFLGFPTHDPHGDPIPSRLGIIPETHERLLSECTAGTEVTLLGVKNDEANFLQYLDRLGFRLGLKFLVREELPYEASLLLEIHGREVIITGSIARMLRVSAG